MAPVEHNPYAPPAVPTSTAHAGSYGVAGAYGAYAVGEILIIPKGRPWPHVCCKCGRDGGVAPIKLQVQKLSYTPPWTIAVALISPLIGVICMGIARKNATYGIPMCDACERSWRDARRTTWLSAIPGLALVVLAMVAGALDVGDAAAAMAVLGILLSILPPIILARVMLRPRFVHATKIDTVAAWVAGIHPHARMLACAPDPGPTGTPPV